jgi:hypothetical protein
VNKFTGGFFQPCMYKIEVAAKPCYQKEKSNDSELPG